MGYRKGVEKGKKRKKCVGKRKEEGRRTWRRLRRIKRFHNGMVGSRNKEGRVRKNR